MDGKWILTIAIALIVVTATCSFSKNPILRIMGGIIFALTSLGFSITTVFLVSVGIRNDWTSDGPGMLMIMMGIVFFGGAALFGWWLTAAVFTNRKH